MPGNVQGFGHVVTPNHHFLLATATHQRQVELPGQGFCRGFPGGVQAPVIRQCHQHFTAGGAEEFHLEQFAPEFRVLAQRREQVGHEGLYRGTGNREPGDGDRVLWLPGWEHDVVQRIPVVPHAKFRAHAKGLGRRRNDGGCRCRERCKLLAGAGHFGCQQGVIVCRINVREGHEQVSWRWGYRQLSGLGRPAILLAILAGEPGNNDSR